MCHFYIFDATTAAAVCLYSEKTEQQMLLLPFSSLRKPATSLSLCWDQGRPWSLLALCQNGAGRGELPMPEENWRSGETNMAEGNDRRKDPLKCWERSKVIASVNNAGKLNSNPIQFQFNLPSVLFMLWSTAHAERQTLEKRLTHFWDRHSKT